MKMIDYLCKTKLGKIFMLREDWKRHHHFFQETYQMEEEREEFKRKALEHLTFEDAVQFAESLQKQVERLSNGVAEEGCESMNRRLDCVNRNIVDLKDEMGLMRKELDFIQTEAFIDGVVERIKSKQL